MGTATVTEHPAQIQPPTAAEQQPVCHPADDHERFVDRHIGPREDDIRQMLALVGAGSLDELTGAIIPDDIQLLEPLRLDPPMSEPDALARLHSYASLNRRFRSFIGMGYSGTHTPGVIMRNIFENPGWYTPYTPYQAEISQGRLEALLNFQTMISDLTGLPLANASLLDEATAAAEAMAMCFSIKHRGFKPDAPFVVSPDCHPQTIAVIQTRAKAVGVRIEVADPSAWDFSSGDTCGVLVQYPATDGSVADHRALIDRAHGAGALVVFAADPLALALLTPPGELGADIAIGSTQRFGVPMGAGGPHAAYLATKSEHARKVPGRIIGVSQDALGNPALRMSIQTREQHIRREKATSNICTAQALLAIIAGMYAVYHGPDGLKRIADRVHARAQMLAVSLSRLGHEIVSEHFFDTVHVRPMGIAIEDIATLAEQRRLNFRRFDDTSFTISLDETTTDSDLRMIIECFAPALPAGSEPVDLDDVRTAVGDAGCIPESLQRDSEYLTHPVFNEHHSETEMLRYIFKLQERDLSLAHAMIPLGSCTMKLNATSEMLPISWPEFADIHPFAPSGQTRGYRRMIDDLSTMLRRITGFPAVSFMPNAGSQGELSGLLAIRAYHDARDEPQRDVCIIPTSAHGTNPASAIMAGMRVVAVKCDELGDIDLDDLKAKCVQHADRLAALMITYPSTHGVFEPAVREICKTIHVAGGQVYMDGANLNALVGLSSPAAVGADVCHLNLHKTFCIPHGGGGPGMGPIACAQHLAPFLPSHPVSPPMGHTEDSIGPVAAAPYGSPLILTISWMYIAMMGAPGLTRASRVAILNANYMAKRLEGHFDVLYTGRRGRVAHEFIIDLRPFDKSAGIQPGDVARRLMDYGFHAPTMSWPVPGTLMIEPTESEPRAELDRFCDALILIRKEIAQIERRELPREDNPLVNAPHTAPMISSDTWSHAYLRSQAAYPAPWLCERKFFPHVSKIDNALGDRHLVCTCPSVEETAQD
jgi:glycine dehydrogenase